MRAEVELTVNGKAHRIDIDVRTTLADAIRDHLGLTGTHLGCEQGVCGSCTVLVEGRSVRSCLTLAVASQAKAIVTIEGLSDPQSDAVRRSFAKHHALQCGFCTPGFLATVVEMIDERFPPHEPEIRERLTGNLCRCTGYQNIVLAVMELLEDPVEHGGYP